ncbi:MAG: Gfo/Idh/MocA family oxidoreductase [Tannerella sp.]|jgi:predicted dehydrogenase|nr:Gfo/Idh/MocA family oxidoreductase [Tannerella sp.]
MTNRRTFIKTGILAGAGLLAPRLSYSNTSGPVKKGLRAGIIGLDTSHSVEFTKTFNLKQTDANEYGGYKVVAAYPHGSKDIESSVSRIPKYTEEVKGMGVRITESIEELLKETDVILLETNDGRRHLEQALEVFKAGKTVFIDKPVAGSLEDAYAIYRAAGELNVPVFSSSSLRYMSNMNRILREQSIGKVTGADTYSPYSIEPTHPDFFWYAIHGIEALFALMGSGCQTVTRISTPETELAVGVWDESRIGTYRGRKGKSDYGGTAFGEKGIESIGAYNGYDPLLREIVKFFQTGVPPVSADETLELFTFMESADESKRLGGVPVRLSDVRDRVLSKM